ncbi:MAG: TRAP transporter small permease subunit [Gammaproteobacteria bacterium]|nr:TRAP transporter small permease subunit [Gammaproteobacteria bacterium]
MALTTMLIVVLRYAFNQGAIVLQESVIYMHALVLMLGIPYALKEDRHVRVDLIYTRLTERSRILINVIGHLVCLVPVCVFILYFSAGYVLSAWRVLERSPEVGGIPGVFLLKTLIPIMAAVLLLQGIAEAARGLLSLRERAREHTREPGH